MFLSLVLALTFSLRAEENTFGVYQEFRQGRPADFSARAFVEAQGELHQLSLALERAFREHADLRVCERFAEDLRANGKELLAQLDRLPAVHDPDSALLTRVRFQLLGSTFKNLHRIFRAGFESGIGVFTRIPEPSCVLDRVAIAAVFDAFVTRLDDVERGAFGRPGLDTLTQEEDDLLRLANVAALRQGHVELAANVAYLGMAMAAWTYLPRAARWGTKWAYGEIPSLLTRPLVTRALRAMGFALDAAAYAYTMHTLSPPRTEAPAVMLGSLEQNLWMVEQLLKSPLNSPELYYAFVNTAKAQLISLQREWLNTHRGELALGREWLTLVAESREALLFPGEPVDLKIPHLKELIQKDYGVRVGCDANFLRGLTAPACLLGLRHVLRAFQVGDVASFGADAARVLELQVAAKGSLRRLNDTIEVHLSPFTQPTVVATKINGARRSQAFTERAEMNRSVVEGLDELKTLVSAKVEFRGDISQSKRFRAVHVLTQLFKNHPDLQSRPTETLLVGHRNRRVFERHLAFTEELNVDDSGDVWTQLLRAPKSAAKLARLSRSRQNAAVESDRLARERGWTATCDTSGYLTLDLCAATLSRLNAFLGTRPDLVTRPGPVVVAGLGELNDPVNEIEGLERRVLVLRADFRYGDLTSFGALRGWLRPRRAD